MKDIKKEIRKMQYGVTDHKILLFLRIRYPDGNYEINKKYRDMATVMKIYYEMKSIRDNLNLMYHKLELEKS